MITTWERAGRHPFQVALLAVSLASGLFGLLLPYPTSTNVVRAFGALYPAFYAALTVAALLGLIGGFWRSTDARALQIGLQVERIGMMLLTGSAGAYAALTFVLSGVRALVAGLLIGGIALAAMVRARQITRGLARVRGWLPPAEKQE